MCIEGSVYHFRLYSDVVDTKYRLESRKDNMDSSATAAKIQLSQLKVPAI